MLKSVHVIIILFAILLLIFGFAAWNVINLPVDLGLLGDVNPVVEPVTSSEMRYSGSWKMNRPVCSSHEFLLTFHNSIDDQVDLYFRRGQERKETFLASVAPKSNIYQCCPHYDVGVHLLYKLHKEPVFVHYYPEIIRKETREVELQDSDFQLLV